MSMMRHQILRTPLSPGGRLISTKIQQKESSFHLSWMHPDLYAFPVVHPNGFYLSNWSMVWPNFYEPYPDDMTFYDITQSLDGD